MNQPHLDPPEWYASLPTVYASAVVLFTDGSDRVLLVKPNYRPHWSLPGGVVEDGEAPHECAVREVAEELGLSIEVGDLLVVDWVPPGGDRPRSMANYLFDGGEISDLGAVRLQAEELEQAEFVAWEDAVARLPANTRRRIPAARAARRDGRTVYLPGTPEIG
ncbi:NUDIX domain-containing protein [Actinomadura chokoriensis]|uniref:NUDIX hydrolase n=1 Tax=Actinomadura chokoriensis TaxID=454156 RepID=A0ABV4R5W2_9ACTN